MPISVQCRGCGRSLKGKDELAGKRVKCPCCGQPIQLPPLTVSDASGSAGASRPVVAAAVPQPLPPPPNDSETTEHAVQFGSIMLVGSIFKTCAILTLMLIWGIGAANGAFKLEFRIFGGSVPVWLPFAIAAAALLNLVRLILERRTTLSVTNKRVTLDQFGKSTSILLSDVGKMSVEWNSGDFFGMTRSLKLTSASSPQISIEVDHLLNADTVVSAINR